MTVGEKLRAARERAGLTLQAVADAAGVELRTYQRFEAGQYLPRVDVAIRIAGVLKTTVEKLFGEK